jgi:hypothetical protein
MPKHVSDCNNSGNKAKKPAGGPGGTRTARIHGVDVKEADLRNLASGNCRNANSNRDDYPQFYP